MKTFYLRILVLSLLLCFTRMALAQEETHNAEAENPPVETVVSEEETPGETVTDETEQPQEESAEAKAEETPAETAVKEDEVSKDTITDRADLSQEETQDTAAADTLIETIADKDTVSEDTIQAELAQEETQDTAAVDTLIEAAVDKDTVSKDTIVQQVTPEKEKFRVSGVITDTKTDENIKGATIYCDKTSDSAYTNINGYYSLTLPGDTLTITYSFTGYEPVTKEIVLVKDTSINIHLTSAITTLDKMVVVGEKKDFKITSTEMSVEKFEIEDIETIPVIMGEKDIMKTIQLTPGITSVAEGRSAIIVRGGSIDQNQIMMDGMPIYYFSHMNGLYSIFNSEAMEDMVVYKGGIPARYGGRAASFLDLTMKEGNNEEFHTTLGAGLIASNFFVEAPIVKEKLSFCVAGRSTRLGIGRLIDTILIRRADTTSDTNVIIDKEQASQDDPRIFTASGAYFNDLNGKIVYHINDKNSLYLSGYVGKDGESEGVYSFHDYPKEWGNRAATLRWSHGFSPKLSSNTSLIYSQYWTYSEPYQQILESGVRTGGLRQEFSWFPNSENTLMFGLCSEYQDFNHGTISTDSTVGEEKTRKGGKGPGKFMPAMQSVESALFVSNDQKIGSKLAAYYGLRYSLFHRVGPGYQVTYDEFNNPTDSLYFHRRKIMQFYHNLEPRFSLNFLINEKNSIKFSYNRTAQYLRLMTNSMQLQYYDIWMPCTKNIKPLTSNQIALGYFRDFADHAVNFSAETFYKTSKREFDFEDGLENYFQSNLEAYVATGRGRSYGLELMLKKPSGKFTGWLSYNLGKSELKIDGINDNKWYVSKFDKTHDVTIVSSFKIFKSLSISGTWVYTTGNAVSLPTALYIIEGAEIPYYSGRNEYRIPDYHRLDLGIIYDPQLFTKLFNRFNREFKTSLEFSLYNVYNRRNINYIGFRTIKGETSSSLVPFGVSQYGIMPSFLFKLIF